MNLGGFAGGLAKGYQSQERLRMAEEDAVATRNLRDRQIKIAEEDQSFQRLDREQSAQMNTELQSVYKSTFGENPAETIKNDPFAPVRFGMAKIELGFKYGKADPKELSELAGKLQEYNKEGQFAELMKVAANDPEAKARVLPKYGYDPAKTTTVMKGGRYVITDGQRDTDLTQFVMAGGLMKYLDSVNDLNKGAQDGMKTVADIDLKGAQKTSALASANASNASAGLSSARAASERAGAPTSAAYDPKKIKRLEGTLGKNEMFKMTDPTAQSLIKRMAMAAGGEPEVSGPAALGWYQKQVALASKNKAALGGMTPQQYVEAQMAARLGRTAASTDEE